MSANPATRSLNPSIPKPNTPFFDERTGLVARTWFLYLASLSGDSTANMNIFHLVSAASTNPTVVKASSGQLGGYYIYNSNAAARKVAFHDTASIPAAGVGVVAALVIPPKSGANVLAVGIAFSVGIAITTVTGLADSDATAVAANDLIINLWYS